VIGGCNSKHRSSEYRKLLGQVEAAVPANLDVHFTPTGASWINQVERFFALLTDKQIRGVAHQSTAHLEAAIRTFLDDHNADPKPSRWSKSADDILVALQRFCLRRQQIGGTAEAGHWPLGEVTQPARRVSRHPAKVGVRFPMLLQSVSKLHIGLRTAAP
jgi:hypothetical protein